ncbi:unnamed protein product [Arabidopsis thaliana]|uniref:(thale cress) hypothetical protein n=1 Tax=Arabidopsis thaliana TaxID=3702 RepID=A0A7G2E9K8_ARATH|nr:unnamed protein product [Arabidopsis thaliana]
MARSFAIAVICIVLVAGVTAPAPTTKPDSPSPSPSSSPPLPSSDAPGPSTDSISPAPSPTDVNDQNGASKMVSSLVFGSVIVWFMI